VVHHCQVVFTSLNAAHTTPVKFSIGRDVFLVTTPLAFVRCEWPSLKFGGLGPYPTRCTTTLCISLTVRSQTTAGFCPFLNKRLQSTQNQSTCIVLMAKSFKEQMRIGQYRLAV
jgi:hypothetical protein